METKRKTSVLLILVRILFTGCLIYSIWFIFQNSLQIAQASSERSQQVQEILNALAATLGAQKLPQKPAAVLGVLADKAAAEMLRALGDSFSTIYAVTPDCPRAMFADELARLASQELPEVPVYPCADLGQALDAALGLPQGAVVCGSLDLAAQARPMQLERL